MTERDYQSALDSCRQIHSTVDKLKKLIESEHRKVTVLDDSDDRSYDHLNSVLSTLPQLTKYHAFLPYDAWELYSELSRICRTCPLSIDSDRDIAAAAEYFSRIGDLQEYANENRRRVVLHYPVHPEETYGGPTEWGCRFDKQLEKFVQMFGWVPNRRVTVAIYHQIMTTDRDGEERVSQLTKQLAEIAMSRLGCGTWFQFYAHGSPILSNSDHGEKVAPWTTRETPGALSAVLTMPQEIHWCNHVISQTIDRSVEWRRTESIGAWLSISGSHRRSVHHPWGEWVWHKEPDLATASYWGWLLSHKLAQTSTGFTARYGAVHYIGGTSYTSPVIVLQPFMGNPCSHVAIKEFKQYVLAANQQR